MSLVLEQVSYSYAPDKECSVRTLSDISLVLETGDFLGIAGPTGSGKTTLLHLMAGLITPRAGSVRLNGVELSTRRNATAVQGQIGLVFQYPERQLFASTVREDIAFGPKNLGLSRKEAEQRVQMALELMELPQSLLDKSPFELSGGQQRSVAIAGVLAMQPKVLLLDEPTAGLDLAAHEQLFGALATLRESGTALCMASHNMTDIGIQCNLMIVLSQGHIAYQGTPLEVFQHEDRLRAIGLDIPESMKLTHALQRAGLPLPEHVYTAENLAETLIESKKVTISS